MKCCKRDLLNLDVPNQLKNRQLHFYLRLDPRRNAGHIQWCLSFLHARVYQGLKED